ncbi:ABC transporter permease [Janibacter melonis]|uniref:ABC transporter permease n=1 Tax=Janibacter melonis TaxID=262209 RepID=UPI002043AB20|nr:ABC transporter permease [Janibacter melonis]MCM3555196.1 ABC transporter permease [Janibacter melonis]
MSEKKTQTDDMRLDQHEAVAAVGPAQAHDVQEATGPSRSLAADAWRSLRSNPLFWISASLITLFVLMAAVPGLFTGADPNQGILARRNQSPSAEYWFGTDAQGYDVYARSVYSARASILVGTLATLGTLLVGSVLGLIAGYAGGWADSIISRIGDIFFAIPLLLAGIVFLTSLGQQEEFLGLPLQGYLGIILQVVAFVVVFGWPSIMRLMRSSVIQVKPNDYVQAARALGASPLRIVRSHVLPNAMAPAIVVSTINLGVYIAVEATLSFLGIGLRPPALSWGVMINDSLNQLRSGAAMHQLYFPALFLSLTVLGFIMFGDAVRDAFDPKSR